MWTALDLGVNVEDDFLEHNVNFGAPFVPPARDLAQVFSTMLTECELGNLNGLDGAVVARARMIERLAFGVRTRAAHRGLVLGRLRRGTAGVRAGLGGVLLH